MFSGKAIVALALGASVIGVLAVSSTGGAGSSWSVFSNVPLANTKGPGTTQYGPPLSASAPNGPAVPVSPAPAQGFSSPSTLSPELVGVVAAQGSTPLENASDGVAAYGYEANGPFLPVASAYTAGPPATVTVPAAPIEANKTEPDKNTFLSILGQKGADANYDYGRNFLYQGHEAGTPGYITRINLDADQAHRVTLMATREVGSDGAPNTGKQLPNFDGSTYNPWTKRLLFTSETGTTGGVWQATLDVPSAVVNLQPYLGRGGFEGIQNDWNGNVYYVEDVGGSNIVVNGTKTAARRPNSFIYRFLPADTADLTKGGKVQALQVLKSDGSPLTFEDGATVDSPGYVALHTYGTTYKTKWVTIATTPDAVTYGATGPDDNALAKAAKATPFKRPENGLFRPNTGFGEFYFDETGDTNATSPANGLSGGWGSIMKLKQSPSSDEGTISVFYNSDQAHTAFDNVSFFSADAFAAVEDAGDTLHSQRNALDSGYLFNLKQNYADPANQPVRFLAQGRDPSATIDSNLSSVFAAANASFPNDGDNEITGITVSNGSDSKYGILGAQEPSLFNSGWRMFYTGQHGDNVTYEVLPNDQRRDR
jgi:hypothetical protein